MSPPEQSGRVYQFGVFEAHESSGELLRRGSLVRLQAQPFRLLVVLLEHAGEVVPREQLRQELWASDTYVEFDGSLNNALKKLRAVLRDNADSPSFIETLPRRGYRFLAPVVVRDAEPESGPKAEVLVVPKELIPSSGFRQHKMAYAIVLLVAVISATGWYLFRAHPTRTATASTHNGRSSRKSVAVLGFHNVSGRREDEWLATAFSEMLSTELATGDRLRLVPGEDIANLRRSSKWSEAETLSPDTTARIGAALNSDLLLSGSYLEIGEGKARQVRLDVRLQNAHSGEILSEFAETSDDQNLFRLTSTLGRKLRNRLGIPEMTDADEAGVLASLPMDREAARCYARGLARLREFDAVAARDLLEQATKADPKFSLGHLMLARAWNQLGYEQRRKEEAKKALTLSAGLPRVGRMLVEGDYYESLADHEKAISTYRALFELFPDSMEYGSLLAAAQTEAGHGTQAGETIARLRQLSPPISDDPRLDLLEAQVTVDKAGALVLFRRAAEKATVQGKKLIYAKAKVGECTDLQYGGHPELALPACEDAYQIYLTAGNLLGAADTMRLMADHAGAAGHFEEAAATYEKALKILIQLGEHEKTGAVLNNMAVLVTNQGKLDRAAQLYSEAKYHFEQAGNKNNTAVALVNLADILYLRGSLSEAEKAYKQDLDLIASIEHGEPEYAMERLADLELAKGQVQDAHRLAQQALDQSVARKNATDDAMTELGGVLEVEGNFSAARQMYQQALDIERNAGRTLRSEETQVALAELAIQEGHPSQAEQWLRPAVADFEKEKADPDITNGYTLLSRALLQQGKPEEAHQAMQHAMAMSTLDPELKLPAEIQAARVEIALAGHGSAHASVTAGRQRLRSAATTARQLGYYIVECEARLALAELDLKAHTAASRTALTQLASEADNRGLRLISHQATELAGGANVMASASGPAPSH